MSKKRYPRYREPLPPWTRRGKQTDPDRWGSGVCKVGRLLTPALGTHRVQTIAAAGGLLPYLARRIRLALTH